MSDSRQKLDRSLTNLNHIIKTLRAPDGCPWDRKQTPHSIKKHLIEEAYEVLDAIDHNIPEDICSELGDLLMQIFFLADLYEEAGLFKLFDISESIQAKLIRRHPHVFDNLPAMSEEQIKQQWETIKAKEKKHRSQPAPPEHDIAPLPSLLATQKWLRRHDTTPLPPAPQMSAHLNQLKISTNQSTAETILGKLLVYCVQLAEQHGIDAETCLRQQLINHSSNTQ
ncbi:MazG nucleotide pyrophosphohydrolase domain-containing protein [uncultured Desulfuromonas sp.]|uniref:MazG nucleotide pyrophosphohydrolase domain-containing protein n=1 Tax=uncultured Desulfuromonas sp. TaxID=181013 RepID=UPI002AAC4499|nr:MazG nucleotide pyrophosphohydrolase domain-containing protein [uncultured Desulfuromonas sp.]